MMGPFFLTHTLSKKNSIVLMLPSCGSGFWRFREPTRAPGLARATANCGNSQVGGWASL